MASAATLHEPFVTWAAGTDWRGVCFFSEAQSAFAWRTASIEPRTDK
jgi:hypothetical protein